MEQSSHRLDPLFHPKSVAVLGASNQPGKWGFGILHNLIAGGFTGKIYPVNRKGGAIQGLPATPLIPDLPEPPDLALVIVPPQEVVPALRELIKKGARSAIIITAGFAELGSEGASLQAELARLGTGSGTPILGPNCMGVISTPARLHAQLLDLRPGPGPLSIVSQSGNIVGSIIHYGNVNQLGFSKAVSSGNEAVIKLHDLLEYLGQDQATGAILMYVEGAPDGRRFFEACREASLKKPVVILKGGVSEAGSLACASHTGHLAGSAQIFNAAARQAGAVLVEDLDELFHAAAAIVAHPRPRGRRAAMVTMGGGWGVLAVDAMTRAGLVPAELSPDTIEKLNAFLADRWSHRNPVDMAATPDLAAMTRALAVLAEDENVDLIIQTNLGFGGAAKKNLKTRTSPAGRLTQVVKFPDAVAEFMAKTDMEQARAVIELERKFGKPIVSCTDVIIGEGVKDNPTLEFMAEHGSPVYPTPAKAARILGKLVEYAEWRQRAENG